MRLLERVKEALRRGIGGLVDFGGRAPIVVLAAAFATLAACWLYAQRLQLRSDFLELLPRDSPGFQAYEHQLGRVGGGASLIVVVESPDRAANEKLIDSIAASITKSIDERKRCVETTDARERDAKCGPDLIAFLEAGTKDVRQFFEDRKWLYADLAELEEADRTLDRQIALQTGLVEDLESEEPPPSPAPAAADGGAPSEEKKPTLGMETYRDKWKKKAREHDDFPTGYFANPDGTILALRIISNTTGTGDSGGDELLSRVRAMLGEINPTSFHPQMHVGLAGDIPNAVAEKESLLSEAALATGAAFVLILGGVVFFYRSPWAIAIIALPPLLGVGCAYAFATATYGYVNSSGAFLGAIIIGNGINYPIVLYSRYKEFRARAMTPAVARREAVFNAFRAELVGSSVASIAYGSLTITQFRGFSQFGMIGFVGMLLVWITMIPCVPALIVAVEWIQSKLPPYLRDPAPRLDEDGSRGLVSRVVGNFTERSPKWIVAFAIIVTLFAASALPKYLRDPWEYNFDKLGSRSSKVGGAGEWSNKAEAAFGGKMNVAGALMLGDSPEQVPALKQRILENDARDPEGKLIAKIASIADQLPGTRTEQDDKLAVLARIRGRLTPAVLHRLSEEERQHMEEIRPPDGLTPVEAKDLPALIRRRFEERNGTVGTVFYVQYRNDISLSDGHVLLRIAKTTDNVVLEDRTRVRTASRSTVFAEIIRSMERDGPLATFASFGAVVLVVLLATSNVRGAVAVTAALVMGVIWTVGGAALLGEKLNFLNFIALPITFGIGSEYPFNIYDRSRLLGGDVTGAVKLHLGAVTLCSYTTVIGYGSLMFADNQALQSFGHLAVAGEVACVFAALLFLPALLHLMPKRARK